MDRLERDLKDEMQVLRLGAGSSVGRQLGARYGVRGVPSYILFDGTGTVIQTQIGRLDADRIRAEIDSLAR